MDEHGYFDIDGKPCSLEKLCRNEPEWAANRIRAELKTVADLQSKLQGCEKQRDEWKAYADAGLQNSVSLQAEVASYASRLHSLVSQTFEAVTLSELRDWIINNMEPDRRPIVVERGSPKPCLTCGGPTPCYHDHDTDDLKRAVSE